MMKEYKDKNSINSTNSMNSIDGSYNCKGNKGYQ